MLYDYQYDIAAILAMVVILIIFIIRKSYSTKSNKLYVLILLCNFIASCADLCSNYAISYPEKVSSFFRMSVTILYLITYNYLAILFLLYIRTLIRIDSFNKLYNIICLIIGGTELLLVTTSPITHWIIYFDKNNVYQHGRLMILLYVLSFFLIILSFLNMYLYGNKFSRYQVYAICSFLVATFVCVIIQAIFPRMVIGNFACAMVTYLIYIAFENPSLYTYRDTKCLNRLAFDNTLVKLMPTKKKIEIVIFEIRDYSYIKKYIGPVKKEKLTYTIADFFSKEYRKRGFCLSENKFVIITENEDTNQIIENVTNFTDKTFYIEGSKVDVRTNNLIINPSLLEVNYEMEISDFLINYEIENIKSTKEIQDNIDKMKRKNDINHIVKRAIANDEFMVFYQPILDVEANKFNSAEALIRLKDEQYGFISPEEFIPIAEQNGDIIAIGETVIRKVCEFLKNTNLEKLGIHYIEINLSMIQCMKEDLAESLLMILDEYSLDSSLFNFEITETADIIDEENVYNNIKKLHERGISFSIDDYGSGFASADYLIRLPVDIVKIDKSILWNAMKDESAMIVLKNTMRMLKELGKKVVVEGVENIEMVKLLKENKCDYMQGYFYSKPIKVEDYIDFLKK